MAIHNSIEDFNNITLNLIEEKIVNIEYYGLRIISENEDFSDYKTKFKNVHSFEIALVLQMENGNIFEFIWDNSFFTYGIGILKKNIYEDYTNEAVTKWIMTDDPFWKIYLNKEIINLSILWETNLGKIIHSPNIDEIEKKEPNIYPVT